MECIERNSTLVCNIPGRASCRKIICDLCQALTQTHIGQSRALSLARTLIDSTQSFHDENRAVDIRMMRVHPRWHRRERIIARIMQVMTRPGISRLKGNLRCLRKTPSEAYRDNSRSIRAIPLYTSDARLNACSIRRIVHGNSCFPPQRRNASQFKSRSSIKLIYTALLPLRSSIILPPLLFPSILPPRFWWLRSLSRLINPMSAFARYMGKLQDFDSWSKKSAGERVPVVRYARICFGDSRFSRSGIKESKERWQLWKSPSSQGFVTPNLLSF